MSALGYPVQNLSDAWKSSKINKNYLEIQEIYRITVGYPVDDTLLSLDNQ